MDYNTILTKLWHHYSAENPSVKQIHEILSARGDKIVNDHVAFRTYDIENINIEKLSEVFLNAGYIEKGSYTFEQKHLIAKHYEHGEDKLAPKVFISELVTKNFSPFVREIANQVAQEVLNKGIDTKDLPFAKTCWRPISYRVYERLKSESEYAAWMYVYGFRANHFTVYVNQLESFEHIENLNLFLKEQGFKLNDSGGEVKGSDTELLKQSSTLADLVDVNFSEGVKKIPCCYYEFAQRYYDANGNIFNGFIAKSADKIFESTNSLK